LRDYPSAHAVIQRNKNQNVKQEEIREVALWLTQESLQKKLLLPGTRLEVVHTECRFVRPIKGDKLGRVNYQNESHFMLVLPKT
jgi:predicted ribosome quality control (RQC) complex YloA/Tae2 family protein